MRRQVTLASVNLSCLRNFSRSNEAASPSAVRSITAKVVRDIASIASIGAVSGELPHAEACALAHCEKVGTSANRLSWRKAGAAARLCHFQFAPSAKNRLSRLTGADKERTVILSRRKNSARATSTSSMHSGSVRKIVFGTSGHSPGRAKNPSRYAAGGKFSRKF